MICDVCKSGPATVEAVVDDGASFLVMSFCSTNCLENSPFEAISNVIHLDMAHEEGVE